MKNGSTASHGLSQQDAFFVAYQEESAVAMQLGAEFEVAGTLGREDLERCLERLAELWPRLGQTVHRRALGLAWRGPVRLKEMLAVAADGGALERWRNTPIAPFREPSFQLLWLPDRERGTLAFRAHHSALDGWALAWVCSQALRILAGGEGTAGVADVGPSREGAASFGQLWRQGHLGPMWRYMRWLRRESRRGRSARLAVQATTPGDIGVCSRRLAGAQWEGLLERSRGCGVQATWLCCAAWMRAIGGWNAERGGDSLPVSLELPVSTRPGRGKEAPELGNGISPLLLFADATRPLEEIARDLRKQFVTGVRRRSHLAVPTFTAAGRYLPWWLFRRLACDTAYSGFATSHFTWLRSPVDRDAIARLSGGRFELLDHRFYGPVCLHMGAALQALETGWGLQLSITHRLNALPAADAAALADRLLAELAAGIS